ncbi:DNA topoisomerase IV subunit A [Geomicrobium sp. JSM 1781026]|uniref:DNA topoisomerase IV subunit A n=1 Tax=Geomicrobium sp. JSM 1781026 TaxID=3344580 RepID=UPI0035BEDB3B
MHEAEKYLDLPLEEVLGDRFGRYSKYIIQERALPDARDGLKPVQRRILYAMLRDNNLSDKPFRKAAKTVGNVIGNYHPHGDSSVYEALVRMSQSWKIRNALVSMHGNNGSIDGDPPAAMRYTEARLSALAEEMLRDIQKDTVQYIPNFDDTEEEPVVLPGHFPNLLVNGSTGISSGYATDIPPHNLAEVIDGAMLVLDRPTANVDDLMTVIKGPDFPGGGTIQGTEGLKQAYETGKGKVILRAKVDVESLRGGKEQLVITEIPYEIVKASLVKRMDEIRFDKKIDGIAEVRDDTDRTGLRIVVELKKEADAKSILHYLYKHTDLQVNYNFNMVAISEKTPKLMGLKALLVSFLDHQKQVVLNRSQHDLNQAQNRAHIVEGLIKAISVLDELIALIRQSKDKRDAKENIMERFGFSEPQSEAIVNLQLYRLTNTDIQTLQEEAAKLQETIEQLRQIIENPKKLIQTIKKELKHIQKTFKDERRTIVQAAVEELKIDMQTMIPQEDVIVTVSREGYIKRTSVRSFTASNGERPGMKDTDDLQFFKEMNTTETLLIFTEKGQYMYIPVHQIPDIRWKDTGQHIANLANVAADDRIVRAMPISEFKDDHYLVFFTKNGMAKRSLLNEYQSQRFARALIAVKLKGDDRVVHVSQTDGTHELMMFTQKGYGLRFKESDVNVVGQRASGVKGMSLKEDDCVVSAFTFLEQSLRHVLLMTQRGAVKRMKVSEFPVANRAKRGLTMLRELKKSPHTTVGVYPNTDELHEVMVFTDKNDMLKIADLPTKDYDRYQTGSYLVDTEANGEVVDVWPYIHHELTKEE